MAVRNRFGLFTTLPLDPNSGVPLYRQLYERVRSAILQGQLSAGTRLPSTRTLSQNLELSRNTVLLAYDQLLAEGYLNGKTGAGTFVSSSLPEEYFAVSPPVSGSSRKEARPAVISRSADALCRGAETLAQRQRVPCAFERVLPALDEFPVKLWAKLVARRWRNKPLELMGYGDPAGYRPLRESIAAYLTTSRGVHCSAEQVIIVPGHLDLLARILLNPGDAVWVEDPCYPGFRRTLSGVGAKLIPVPVDEEGLNVEVGKSLCPNARVVYVTPSHQYPFGVTMSLPRRMALLEWARRSGAWIIEDDYGSEFRYRGRPLPCLQGLDRYDRVIYIGSLSRVLFPALRVSYIVVPPSLVDACLAARSVLFGPQSIFEQSVAADFMDEGHFVRHLRRMRTLYADRQNALLRAAARELAGLIDFQTAEGGMFLVGWLPKTMNDQLVSRRCLEQGVVADPLSPLFATKARRGALLLGYSSIGPARIREGVRKLGNVLRAFPRAER